MTKYFICSTATDALAVALCHFYQSNSPLAVKGKALKGWGDFIAKNEGRVRK